MNAIKLPVVAYAGCDGQWFVRNEDKIRLAGPITEAQVKQIAISLNCHEALVEALSFYAIPSKGDFYHDAGKIARAALAKVEKLKADHLLAEAKRYAGEL